MKIFKFGGASVKNAEAVKHVADIIKSFKDDDIMIILSAMGKMTNALEDVTHSYFYKKNDLKDKINCFVEYHCNIISELFDLKLSNIYSDFEVLTESLNQKISKAPSHNYDFEYDQIVPYGELLSTLILNYYLNENGINCRLFDARQLVKTDNKYREAKVDWDLTVGTIQLHVYPYFLEKENNRKIALTQGFIGGAAYDYTTTLGREGSDYTAAIFAYALKATETVIWKDVPGILNADPRYFKDAKKVDYLTYSDAIELAYYGASVIHPDTIKPLRNKKIPLYVKSFLEPEKSGTEIKESLINNNETFFIIKPQQIVLSLSPKDFSYIAEKSIIDIFTILEGFKIRVNAMQTSAIGLSICINYNQFKIDTLLSVLRENYKVKYNENLVLITIRNYNFEAINKVKAGKKVILEQISRLNYQVILEEKF